jgi:hypothetical protein
MRGIKSFGMVMCASNSDHTVIETLIPPAGSVPGDRVYFKDCEGTPDAMLVPKKKVFEGLQCDFKTGEDCVAMWKGVAFQTDKGVVTSKALKNASIS